MWELGCVKLKLVHMPKRKQQGRKQAERHAKAIAKRERKAGLYSKPGDPDFKSLSDQLVAQGLGLRDVLGDGNCLFRALGQQLDDSHGNLRQRIVQHIRDNSDDYAPFLDEDTSFESYVDELSQDGTYAGNDAIVAVSRVCLVNIVIHQLGAPCWEVRATLPTDRTVHIAYLRGEHYCSVEPLHPAQTHPTLEARHQQQMHKKKGWHQLEPSAAVAKSSSQPADKKDVDSVLEGTGCQDRELAEQCLKESGGEIDLAIVELLQLMALMEENGGEDPMQVDRGGSDAAGYVQQPTHRKTPTATPQVPTTKQRHLSNRERKAAAKAARKDAARDTRKQNKVEGKKKDSGKDTVAATTI